MSGTFTSRVNRSWDDSAGFGGETPKRWFWEWLHFVNDHTGMRIVEVHNGTSSQGSMIPAGWLTWDGTTDPVLLSPSMGDNSWIVFEAENADPELLGGGGMPWQMKIQVTSGVAYADPSGSDYGQDGNTHCVVMRCNVMGGWIGSPTFDFQPGTSEVSSDDMLVVQTETNDFWLDIVGDDDTIIWRSSMILDIAVDNPYSYARGGYCGMIARRSDDITYPFLFSAATNQRVGANSTNLAIWGKNTTNSNYQWTYGHNFKWPSYSVAQDKTAITIHKHDTYRLVAINRMATYHWTGEDILPAIRVAQWQSIHVDLIGELRMVVATDSGKGHGQVHGDNGEWIQAASGSASYGGISMRYPPGTVALW